MIASTIRRVLVPLPLLLTSVHAELFTAPNNALSLKHSGGDDVLSAAQHYVATLAPAPVIQAAAANLPPQPFPISSPRLGFVSPQPVRNIDDWQVDDFTLLATVDGSLVAVDRTTGETIWTIGAERPMVETTHYPPQSSRNVSNSSETEDSIHNWIWSVEPREGGQIFVWTPLFGDKSKAGGLHATGLSMKTIVEELSPYAEESRTPRLVFNGDKTTDMVTIEAATGKVLSYFGHSPAHTVKPDRCVYDSKFDTEPSSRGVFTLGRNRYTVTIANLDTQEHVARLVYSEWIFNQANRDLVSQTSLLQDTRPITGRPDGMVLGFGDNHVNPIQNPTLMLSSPVANVLDVLRPRQMTSTRHELLIIPQGLQDEPIARDQQLTVFLNATEAGGWYALPARSYPLVLAAPRAGIATAIPSISHDFVTGNKSQFLNNLVGKHVLVTNEAAAPQSHYLALPAPSNIGSKEPSSQIQPPGIGAGPITDMSTVRPSFVRRIFSRICNLVNTLLQRIWDLISHPVLILLFLTYLFYVGSLAQTQNRPVEDKLPADVDKLTVEDKLPADVDKLTVEMSSMPAESDFVPTENDYVPTEAVSLSTEVASLPAALPDQPAEVASLPLEVDCLPAEVDNMPDTVDSVRTKNELLAEPTVPEPTLTITMTTPKVSFATDVMDDTSVPATPEPSSKTKKRARGARGGRNHRKKKGKLPPATPSPIDAAVGAVQSLTHDASLQSTVLVPDIETVIQGKPDEISGPVLKLNNHLEVDEDHQLGTGSNGTVVFAGKFDGRAVAVKRMLMQFYDIAVHETRLLKESDDHPNVIRYYAQMQTGPFLYIALELCKGSLADLVERPASCEEIVAAARGNTQYVMCQIAEGLRFLHDLRIVHRDLKPHNILINLDRQGLPRLVVSDFGLCKKLEGGQSSFGATTAHAAGTLGWRAPELLVDDDDSSNQGSQNGESGHSRTGGGYGDTSSNRRVTRAIDMFSLGLVYFYVLTGGLHPFDCGDKYMREVNIRKGQYDLGALVALDEDSNLAVNLISNLLQANHHRRPVASDVLKHPFFWSNRKKLSFLCDVSDHFEKEIRDPPSAPLVALENLSKTVIPSQDFLKQLPPMFVESLGKQRKYTGNRMLDLLRAIRNKKNHYEDMSEPLQKIVGSLPDGYLHFWTVRFRLLILEACRLITELGVAKSERFREYYTPVRPDASIWK